MVEKEKIIVILLIVAILFSVISTVVSLSLVSYKPVSAQPRVIYTGDGNQGDPNAGVRLYIQPRPEGGAP